MALWRKRSALIGAAAVSGLLLWLGASRATPRPAGESATAAICPIVYPLDQATSERGYRYIFFGNAFFIDRDGYLITAAHVLTDFHDGGQPHVVLRVREAPPRLVRVELVASDAQHDVAILRAVPNPFEGRYEVASLPLASNGPAKGAEIVAEALRPARIRDPRTFDAPQEDKSPAEVLDYISFQLSKGQPKGELFLFSHEVIRGQSGAPVLSGDKAEVVGIVEGQWLHSTPLSAAAATGKGDPTLGAAVPIGYALELLKANHVSWHTASDAPASGTITEKLTSPKVSD